MTNKYEDFAESFTFYVFHNREFARRSQKSIYLKKKYDFFTRFVLSSDAFVGTSFERLTLPNYLWDTTKAGVSVRKFLQYID